MYVTQITEDNNPGGDHDSLVNNYGIFSPNTESKNQCDRKKNSCGREIQFWLTVTSRHSLMRLSAGSDIGR